MGSFCAFAVMRKISHFHSDAEIIQKCSLNFTMIQRNSENPDSEFFSDSETLQNHSINYSEKLLNQY